MVGMQAVWKGALAFGLLSVPVRVYSATEDHDIGFHQVHRADGGRVRYKRVCSVDGEEVPYSEIAKGYTTTQGSTVVLTDAELEAIAPARSREMSVVEFVPSSQVDPVLFDRSYYLEPDPTAARAYALLRETLRATERTAIVQVTLRSRTRLGALRVRDDVLVLQTLHWRDEIRDADFPALREEIEVRPREREAAEALVSALSDDFAPERFHDEYREQVVGVLEGKIARGDVVAAAEEPESGAQVVDLLAALQASVDRARAGTGGSDADAPPAKARKPARRTRKSA